ncbi:ectoine/hydroxyectoine ABC transporter permease subunit EhuC [Aureibacillus halotolerans]|uniref:Amino acid ABC transporter membrane protein 1 (PAAT family) n=1 Tax=Aureibacillus halotolerans TaxID=1508390 RepID=A0A4R6TWM7_9BACI|nr:ectoine/hydroxyectoine ABC transporter permease subunit EhuC [Aureibacillus halotolerans]TDQ36419.1 amino acid ABC transporter membrane protein 1 (PAAT family) [Aureibacillus halotolerans]
MSISEILPRLYEASLVTIQVLLVSIVFMFIIAFIAGLSRVSKYKFVRVLTLIYVEFFRGTSLLIQLFWIMFAVPLIFGIRFDPFLAGVIALSLNYGAYSSEVVRSSIEAVSKGQTEAGIALNMSRRLRMFRIILPQAFRRMLPGFGNNVIELLKGTSLLSFITLTEATRMARNLANQSFDDYLTIFTCLLLVYFTIALPLVLITKYLERRASRGVADA